MTDDVLRFPRMPGGVPDDVVHAVEALLFAAGEPVTSHALSDALGLQRRLVEHALVALEDRRRGSGVELRAVAGGWQLRTASRFADAVNALRGSKPKSLSAAALEVLSVIAYRQPVTRGEVDALRGVDSGRVVKALVEQGLARVAGRRDQPGRPLEYRTTGGFLEMFGLSSLTDLPTLAERRDLVGREVDTERSEE
ncbi:MAG: segregation and condensation protein B [Myxococcota bacterium]|jgi:segregation and condensation protein B